MKDTYMISEIDIKDFDILPIRELYKVKPRSYVQIPSNMEVLFFDHIDGSYSFCLTMAGEVTHVVAWEKVHPLVMKDKDPSPQSTTD